MLGEFTANSFLRGRWKHECPDEDATDRERWPVISHATFHRDLITALSCALTEHRAATNPTDRSKDTNYRGSSITRANRDERSVGKSGDFFRTFRR